eukprot:m.317052 g.317052  ORF g.317052 m.317052 type:complete len:95 (+) comp23078_c0_seq11:9-293(+)
MCFVKKAMTASFHSYQELISSAPSLFFPLHAVLCSRWLLGLPNPHHAFSGRFCATTDWELLWLESDKILLPTGLLDISAYRWTLFRPCAESDFA